jgi:hypothetical protein
MPLVSADLSAAVKLLAEWRSLGFELAAISNLLVFTIGSVALAVTDLSRRKPVEQIHTEFKRALTRSS